MENEVREVTYISISLIIVAIILGFISFGLGIKQDMAASRNEAIAAKDEVSEHREYNMYNAKTISGDDAIELIRQKYDSGVSVFVDYRTNDSTGGEVGASEVSHTCPYCLGNSGDHRLYNLDMYILHKDLEETYNYFALSANSTATSRNDLRNWYKSADKFRAYLVYNSEDPVKYYNDIMQEFYTTFSGSAGNEDDVISCLDSCVKQFSPSATVSGVILINYKTLGLA